MHALRRRAATALRLATAGLALVLGSSVSLAQDSYPSRSIRVVVPYSAGGNTDIITRDVMKGLSARLGQTVLIDNKPGANSILGTDLVAKAAPDGYTLLVVIGAFANNGSLHRNLPYKPTDLTPVSQLTRTSLVVVSGRPDIKTFADLLRSGHDAAAPQTFASSGVGSAAHLLGERLARGTGMKGATHVPYKGSSDARADLASGRVGFMFDAISAMGPLISDGKLTALAVTGERRSPQLPQVPSMTELGHPELVSYAFAGVMAPAKTPRKIVERLSKELAAVLKDPALRTRLEAISTEPVGSSPAEFGRFLAQEEKIDGDIIRQLKLSLD
jgi:tripartite-type tricarboxylate transporter receptor subunit TctC